MKTTVRYALKFLQLVSVLCVFPVPVKADWYNIPSSIRFTLEREDSELPIVYYFSPPDSVDTTYPILILCEGSSNQEDIGNVFFIRECFIKKMELLQVEYLTVAKRGVAGNQINEKEFWNHYSRSQRLEDHLKVIKHFEEQPPVGWNGKLIFIGVSKGGPLVTDLSILCSNAVATINWIGAGDWPWADQFW